MDNNLEATLQVIEGLVMKGYVKKLVIDGEEKFQITEAGKRHILKNGEIEDFPY